jgi:hypothetical protein
MSHALLSTPPLAIAYSAASVQVRIGTTYSSVFCEFLDRNDGLCLSIRRFPITVRVVPQVPRADEAVFGAVYTWHAAVADGLLVALRQ